MGDAFISKILEDSEDIENISWISENIVNINRKEEAPFKAAIIKQIRVEPEHIEPFFCQEISVIANFPKVGIWTGDAIDLCELYDIAWGQWGILLRALGQAKPEQAQNPEIAFARKMLTQHSRVIKVGFVFDHLLKVEHVCGKIFQIALVYQYDLTAEDVRSARDRLGKFDVILKTNPNGSILDKAYAAAGSMGVQIFNASGLMSYLAKVKK